jgi:hypothetical protein
LILLSFHERLDDNSCLQIVFRAVERWLCATDDRRQHCTELLQCVRFNELNREFIDSKVIDSKVVQLCPELATMMGSLQHDTPPTLSQSRGTKSIVILTGITDPKDAPNVLVFNANRGEWMDGKPCANVRRHAASACMGDGRIFVIGGLIEENQRLLPSPSVETYNPVQGTWMQGCSLPMALTGLRAAELNGVLYVTGGSSAIQQSVNSVYAWSPESNSYGRQYTDNSGDNNGADGHLLLP